ncbi:MAG TPA: hypothetical protein G4O13_06050 [Dehalococcoidia bacterium]|nr:hypothetical protein [Dehalococcoidia bacterium]
MRPLSDTLKAAQVAPATHPYLKVEVYDKVGGIARLNWTRFYEGSEDDYFHACAMPGSGSLIRLRVDPADNKLYRQVVTSPDENSDYYTWTEWGVDAYAVALAACGANVWAFRIDATDGHLYRSDSTDSGSSWGNWTDMGDISGDDDFRLAACAKNATEAIVLYSNGSTLYRRRLSGGSWESPAAWTNSLHSISGVAVAYMGDWNIVVTGKEAATQRAGVWSTLLGDGYSAAPGNWGSLKEIVPTYDADSDMAFSFPALGLPDVFRLFFVESFSSSESYNRPYWTHSLASADFSDNLWREPVPYNLSSQYGLALCSSSTHVWLTRPDLVSRAPLNPDSCDLTADVLGLKSDVGETGGEVVIILRNDDGRYAGTGSGDYEAIKTGSEIRISPGYRTSQGIETSPGPAFWITGWEYVSQGDRAHFILRASDAWSLLEAYRPRRSLSWAAGENNIFQFLSYVFARAGLEFSTRSSSPAITDQEPAFTIPAGQTGKRAVLRLLEMVPDVIYTRGHYGYLVHPQTDDSTDYEYGTEHAILEGLYRRHACLANRVQVQGADLITEDFYFTEVDLIGDRLYQVHDINLDTTARAHARGESVLRLIEIHARSESIAVPLNCGQELYDVVEVTDPRASLDAVKRRCLGLQHTFDTRKGIYSLRIVLGDA